MAQIFMHHQALAAGYVHFVTRYCDRSRRENIPYTENGPEQIAIPIFRRNVGTSKVREFIVAELGSSSA